MTTEDRVRRLIVATFGVDAAKVTPAATLREDLGADSIDMVELVMAMEEDFSIAISDDATQAITTVSDAVALVDRLRLRTAA